MNLSGSSVKPWIDYYKVELRDWYVSILLFGTCLEALKLIEERVLYNIDSVWKLGRT
jgi:hypothetical protein